MYDDCGPFFNRFGNSHGPPPPISSYHSPYAETLRSYEGSASRIHRTTHPPQELFPPAPVTRNSQPRSKYSEPVSPRGRRTSDLPPSGFQYGSGPIPRGGEIYNNYPSDAGPAQAPAVDPVWLNNLLTTAVKQGVEESRRMDAQSPGHTKYKIHTVDAETKNQPPGAWPDSPFNAPSLPHQQSEQPGFSSRDDQSDHGSNWKQSQTGWVEKSPRSRVGTHVTWNPEPVDETASPSIGGWNSLEETPSDSWDTGDTWPTDRVAEWEASSQQGKHWVPDTPSHYNARPSSPITPRSQDRRSSKRASQPKSRSKSRSKRSRRKHNITSSSEENGNWSYLDRPSDSVVSLSSSNDTLQPSHSRSRRQMSRLRSKSRSRLSRSVQRGHERKPSRRSHTPTWSPADAVPAHVPSVDTRMTPAVMNASIPTIPVRERSRKSSAYVVPPASVLPPPEWCPHVQGVMRKSSIAVSNMAPAPYTVSLKELVRGTVGESQGNNRPSSSSSWGNNKEDSAVKVSWGKEAKEDAGWSKQSDSGWQEKEPEDDKPSWYSTDDENNGGWAKDNDKDKAEAGDSLNSKQNKEDATNNWVDLKSALKSAFENAPVPKVPWQNQSWTLPTADAAKPVIHQATTTPFASAPAPISSPTNNPHPSSQRMSNKSLSKYRPKHPSQGPASEPHWQFPPPPSASTQPLFSNNTYIAPAEPRLTISQQASSTTGIKHAVRPGKATHYGHAVGRPEYLDGLGKPYAVFRFKYRSVGVLKGLFGEDVDTTTTTFKNEVTEKKKPNMETRLKNVPQGDLSNKTMTELQKGELMVKGKNGDAATTTTTTTRPENKRHEKESMDKGNGREEQRRMSEKTDGITRNFTERWVERHSRDASVAAKSLDKDKAKRQEKEKKKKEKSKERGAGETWGQDDNDGWEGRNVQW